MVRAQRSDSGPVSHESGLLLVKVGGGTRAGYHGVRGCAVSTISIWLVRSGEINAGKLPATGPPHVTPMPSRAPADEHGADRDRGQG